MERNSKLFRNFTDKTKNSFPKGNEFFASLSFDGGDKRHQTVSHLNAIQVLPRAAQHSPDPFGNGTVRRSSLFWNRKTQLPDDLGMVNFLPAQRARRRIHTKNGRPEAAIFLGMTKSLCNCVFCSVSHAGGTLLLVHALAVPHQNDSYFSSGRVAAGPEGAGAGTGRLSGKSDSDHC